VKRFIILLLPMLVLSAGHVAAQNPLVSEGTSGPGRGKHIVFLAGDHSFWALGMEKAITPALEISFVGPYHPATFDMGGHRRGVKPAELAGWDAPIMSQNKPIDLPKKEARKSKGKK